jgi:hypothetical protein
MRLLAGVVKNAREGTGYLNEPVPSFATGSKDEKRGLFSCHDTERDVELALEDRNR